MLRQHFLSGRVYPPPADAPVYARGVRWLNVAAKVGLVALLAYGTFSGAEQFEGKGMGARLATYPISTLIVPVAWWLRGRRPPYPHLVDLLIVAPFLIDTAGNTVDAYSWKPFDDIAHFLNWALLVTGFGAFLSSLRLGRLNTFAVAVAFGASTHIVWELLEWVVMQLGESGLQLTYEDTIGDLALSFAGTIVGAVVAARMLWGRRLAGGLYAPPP